VTTGHYLVQAKTAVTNEVFSNVQLSILLSFVANRKAVGSVDSALCCVGSGGGDGARATDIDTEMSGASLGWTAMCGQESEPGTFYLLNVATVHSTDRQTDRHFPLLTCS
jgi:hypothetical protein